MVLALAPCATAATLVTFITTTSGDTISVTNPQPAAVTGRIRLIPDAGIASAPVLQFSLGSLETRSFPNVLANFGAPSVPAILALETSDVVRVSSAPLQVGFPERHLTLSVRFNPATPGTGSLTLGILNGATRVNIYEHQESVTPLATRVFASAGEEVMRLRYADVLPTAMAISDGYAELIPLSGQVVGTAVNPPMRRHAVVPPSTPPPTLSITGTTACEFAGGIHASVPLTSGATYRWSLVNAMAQGSLAENSVDLVLGNHGYAAVALERMMGGSTSSTEVVLAIDGKPVFAGSSATSVTLGEDATITWALSGGAPTSQTLSGTDFGTLALEPTATSYTFRPSLLGAKTYSLSAENACGSDSARGDYAVSAACATPHIDSFTNSGPACAGSPVQLIWATSGSGTVTINNGVGTVGANGSITVSPSATTPYTITKTSSCGSHAATTMVTITPPPSASTFTISKSTVAAGDSATITFTIADATSWTLSSSLGNSFATNSGTGSGTFNITYNADNGCGDDTVTLTLTGPCGTRTRSLSVTACDPPPIISNFTSTPTAIALGETTTLHFTIQNGSTWTLSSSIGNGFNQSSGTGSGPFMITYSAASNVGIDTVTLHVSGPGGAASATVEINVGVPVITSFTASPTAISFGGTSTLHFTMENGANSSWHLTSSLGNTFSTNSGSGSGDVTVTYNADNATGTDTVTLQTMGEGFTRSATVTITVK